ncbi:hypothetical protein [Wielerella bovis]|nr:hypothetical protein [Wielerella bovis]
MSDPRIWSALWGLAKVSDWNIFSGSLKNINLMENVVEYVSKR